MLSTQHLRCAGIMNPSEQPLEALTPPWPLLQWREGIWEGECALSAWAGFQSRRGAYDGMDSAQRSDGKACLIVGSPHPNDRALPSPEQRRAFDLLLKEQTDIRDAMMDALLKQYQLWREDWADAMAL